MIRKETKSIELSVKKIAPAIAIVPAALAYVMYTRSSERITELDRFFFIMPLLLSLTCLVLIPFTNTRLKYYTVQTFAVFFYLLTLFTTAGYAHVQLIIHLIFISELILYEPFPHNLAASLGLTALLILLDVVIAGIRSIDLNTFLKTVVFLAVPGFATAFFGSLMTKHRELVVGLARDRDRLTNSVIELTRANSAYQDYAVVVQESATEKERRRITRDIHDIVGYTLTNNMMLMEAALDLLKENALALPSIIETARENAQEGLDQVRAAMYKLREQENAFPIGLNAITRLSRIFQQATGIVVHNNFRNMPIITTDEIDSSIYHLVQEALVNAFRHGNAKEVYVSFWYSDRQIQVNIRDDGAGANQISEGIGITGMRERIEKIGGSVSTRGLMDGFLVSAMIPMPGVD